MGLRFNIGNSFSIPLDPERVNELTDSVEYDGQVSALKLLRFSDMGKMTVAGLDSLINARVQAIALTAGDDGDIGDILFYGKLKDQSFNFQTIGARLFLNTGGTISETAPTTGYWMPVGIVISEDTIFFGPFGEPIGIA